MVLKCNLSENPCRFFKVFRIKAIIMRNCGVAVFFRRFDLGNHRVCGIMDFTLEKQSSNPILGRVSGTIYIYTPNVCKIMKFDEN